MTKKQKKNFEIQIAARRMAYLMEDKDAKTKELKLNPAWVNAPFADCIVYENGHTEPTGLRFSAPDRKTLIPKWI